MLNAFNETQLEVISDLAGFYWDHRLGISIGTSLSYETREALKGTYIRDIVNGLVDPEVWPDDERAIDCE